MDNRKNSRIDELYKNDDTVLEENLKKVRMLLRGRADVTLELPFLKPQNNA